MEDLELPEEIYPQIYEGEPHLLKDSDWLLEVRGLADDLRRKAGELQKEIDLLTSQTEVVKKFKRMKTLLKAYGSHKYNCKYLKTPTPKCGEEYKLCDCGWYEIGRVLRRR